MEKVVENTKIKNMWNFIIMLSICILAFGYNEYLNIALITIIAIVVVRLDIEKLLLSYIYLYFFEEVLCLKNLYGLTMIIISPIIAIRLICYILKNKVGITKGEIGIFIFFTISSIVSIMTTGLLSATLIVEMNVIIILMFSMIMRNKYRNEDIKNIIENIFLVIIFACINSILYGILHGTFMQEARGGQTITRFEGAYEPNYTALFLNLGLLSTIYLWKKIGKNIAVILISIFIVTILLTESTTGLGCLIITSIILLIKNFSKVIVMLKKRKGLFITILLLLIVFIALITLLEQKVFIDKIFDKLSMVIEKIEKDELASATSGRLPIIKSFIENFQNGNIINQLFGNAPQALKVYSEYFEKEVYSHNTYIDLIYGFGIVGAIILTIFIIKKMKNNMFLSKKIDGEYKDLILFSRIILLISGLAISLHCEIITLVLFLI